MNIEINRREFLKGSVLAVVAGVIPKNSGEIIKSDNKKDSWGTYLIGQERMGNILQLEIKNLKEVDEQAIGIARMIKVENPNVVSMVISGQKGEVVLPLVWSEDTPRLSNEEKYTKNSGIKERYIGWGRDSSGKLVSADTDTKLDLIPLAKLTMPKGSENFGVVIGPMKTRTSIEPFMESGVTGWMLNLPTKDGIQMINVSADNYKKLQSFLSG